MHIPTSTQHAQRHAHTYRRREACQQRQSSPRAPLLRFSHPFLLLPPLPLSLVFASSPGESQEAAAGHLAAARTHCHAVTPCGGVQSGQALLTDTDYENMTINWNDCDDYEIIRKVAPPLFLCPLILV